MNSENLVLDEKETSLNPKIKSKIFFSLYGAVFTTMLGIGIVIPLLPRYAETMGASGLWIGIIFSSFALARAISMPFFGKKSDEIGRKNLIIAGLAFFSLFSVMYIFADTVLSLTAVRSAHGIASAMVFPIAMAYIGDIAPLGSEGRYMGTFTSSMFLGMGLGPLIGGVVTDLFGIDAAFSAMTLLTSIALLTCVIFLPDVKGKPHKPISFRSLFFYPDLRIPIFYQLINAFANGTFMVFLPVIAAHIGELTPGETGTIISISILSNALLQRFFGTFADRFNRYILIAMGCILIGSALALVPAFHGFWPYVIFSILMGLGGGISVPAMFAMITVAGRDVGQGAAMGVVNTVMSAGMIISPLLCGGMMDIAGIGVVFYISAVIVLISVPVFLMAGSARRSEGN